MHRKTTIKDLNNLRLLKFSTNKRIANINIKLSADNCNKTFVSDVKHVGCKLSVSEFTHNSIKTDPLSNIHPFYSLAQGFVIL